MNKKFVASYSGGKDSILAIYRAIMLGFTPVLMIITYNIDKNRSWFHGLPEGLLEKVERSLEIPIHIVKTTGHEYENNFEIALNYAKNLGANTCVFGDIDIDSHRKWCNDRCENVGISSFFPLWKESRQKLVYEFIDSKFIANFTVIDTARLSDELLGQKVTTASINLISTYGADVCGENGEYHTFVSDGPIFKYPVDFRFGEKILEDKYAILPIK